MSDNRCPGQGDAGLGKAGFHCVWAALPSRNIYANKFFLRLAGFCVDRRGLGFPPLARSLAVSLGKDAVHFCAARRRVHLREQLPQGSPTHAMTDLGQLPRAGADTFIAVQTRGRASLWTELQAAVCRAALRG